MQVSWIEPEQLRDLVGQLQGTPAGGAAAWELHTLPAVSPAAHPASDERPLWLGDLPAAEPAPAPLPMDESREFFSPAALAAEPPAGLPEPQSPPEELDRIRDKLRAIRERAIEAGLLAHVQPHEVADPAHEPAAVESSPPPHPPPTEAAMVSPFAVVKGDESAETRPFTRELAPAAVHHEPAPTSFTVPMGSLSQRIHAFAEWASRRMNSIELFIVDDHGDVLWGEHAQAGLIVSATMACKAAARSSALGACEPLGVIEQPITEGRALIIVPCQTTHGPLSITLIREHPLSQNEATLLREALLAAVETQLPSPITGTALD